MEQQGRLYLTIEDASGNLIPKPNAYLIAIGQKRRILLEPTGSPGGLVSPIIPVMEYRLQVGANDFQSEAYPIQLQKGINCLVISLGKKGQRYYWQGGMKYYFEPVETEFLLSVTGKDASKKTALAIRRRKLQFEPVSHSRTREANSSFVRVRNLTNSKKLIQEIVSLKDNMMKSNLEIKSAFILKKGANTNSGLTDELFVQFNNDISNAQVQALAKKYGMKVKREVLASGNAYIFQSNEILGYKILDVADKLLKHKEVNRVEPEILHDIEVDAYIPNDPIFNQQTHLPLINADEAWELMRDFGSDLNGGSPDICIAVFDPHGVDPTHPDLTANLTDGNSKMLQSFDFRNYQAQTFGNLFGNHGTQCAGTATAAFDNNRGIAGVAPNCRLIGAQRPSPATGTEMADAFLWAVGIDNGSAVLGFPALPTQPADVISNSWGVSFAALSTPLQNAFDLLTDSGRGGSGAIITFSTGNLGYTQFSNIRTFASYNRTIAVGASININPTNPVNSSQANPNGIFNNIPTAVDTRTLYNPWGPEMEIVAPSHTCYPPGGGLTDPTTSSVRVGNGNLDGCPGAAVCNDYAASFGGTSHSSPTIAGSFALVFSCHPLYSWEEARDVLRTTAVRIDAGQANPVGQWVDNDGDGVNEFSQWYGYGRVDVEGAVRESLNMHIATMFTD